MSDAQPELVIWTIYLNPLDAPGKFVLRPWTIRDGKPVPGEARIYEDLDEARAQVPPGLSRLDRNPVDEPQVVESWI